LDNISLVKGWFQDCKDKHEFCTWKTQASLPTRVIDIQTMEPFLYIAQGELDEYVVLSHCWGLSKDNPYHLQYMTTQSNLESRLSGIKFTEMPRTFQDAVTASRAFGFKYLWIDSLCIIQDSPTDMTREISRMAEVYGHATLTIAATRATNSKSGFLERNPPRQPVVTMPLHPTATSEGELGFYNHEGHARRAHWDGDVECTAWNSRAWTFQERIISGRVLHFTSNGLYYECRTCDTSEFGDLPRPSIQDHRNSGLIAYLRPLGYFEYFARHQSRFSEQKIYQAYYRLAIIYSRRKLTFQHDKAAAFSAISSQFERLLSSKIFHGLWAEDMAHGLLWSLGGMYALRVTWGRGQRPGDKNRLTIREASTPSWSWYNSNHEVAWRTHTPERTTFSQLPKERIRWTKNLGTDVTRPPGLEIWMHVMKGRYSQKALVNEWQPQPGGDIYVDGQRVGKGMLDNGGLSSHFSDRDWTVWCIRIPYLVEGGFSYSSGLMVEPVNDSCFRRIGYLEWKFASAMGRGDGVLPVICKEEDYEWISLV
jgi:hypothetical protein